VTEVTETQLPGVGIRYDFTTSGGDLVGVLCHHSGRREIVVYDRDDPDRAHSVLQLSSAETRTLAETLGASQVREALGAIQQRIEGLVLEWIEVDERSPMAGRSIGDGHLRARTGASVVAIIRGAESVPAPGPEAVLQPGDVVVAIGAPDALEALRRELRG
jgi:TrkA domain protein